MKKVCQICGGKIRPNTRKYACNIAVIGTSITIRGHPGSVDNAGSLASQSLNLESRCKGVLK